MGRVIIGSKILGTPVVRFEKPGDTFEGVLKAKKSNKNGGIFEFAITGGNVDLGVSSGEKNELGRLIYNAIDVDAGALVTVFGNTQLDDKLGNNVQIGERVLITYNGYLTNQKSGRQFKDFKVEVL